MVLGTRHADGLFPPSIRCAGCRPVSGLLAYNAAYWPCPTASEANRRADGNRPLLGNILAASVGTVISAEIGASPVPTLRTTSPTANGATRSWTKVDDFVQEVANARIYDDRGARRCKVSAADQAVTREHPR
jgi:hypothetical protein